VFNAPPEDRQHRQLGVSPEFVGPHHVPQHFSAAADTIE
jgi:hypothetical protein